MSNKQNACIWVSIADTKQYPIPYQTVFLYNAKDKCVWLGCHVYVNNIGWLWAISDGNIHAENGKIVSYARIDDDYEVTHWCSLPDLP